MRILHLMPYSPEPPVFGGAIRSHYILQHLLRHHDVTVVCTGAPETAVAIRNRFPSEHIVSHVVPPSWPARFRRLGQLYSHWTEPSFLRLLYRPRNMEKAINRLLENDDFDLVQAESFMMGSLRLETDAVRIVDAHNVEYDNHRRMAEAAQSWLRRRHYRHECEKLVREELDTYRQQDAIFVTSARDRDLLSIGVPEVPKFVVPNGVDPGYFSPSPIRPDPFSLVFSGMMGYVPNCDAMMYFLDEIFPRILRRIPQATLTIVGGAPPPQLLRRSSPGVHITGPVADVRPYVSLASVVVIPLRMGGGTRIKLLEAMAMRKPVVTTSIGCEGIDVEHGVSALIADRADEFADCVSVALRDQALRSRLTDAAYELVRSRYDWSIIGKQLDEIYLTLVEREGVQIRQNEQIREDVYSP